MSLPTKRTLGCRECALLGMCGQGSSRARVLASLGAHVKGRAWPMVRARVKPRTWPMERTKLHSCLVECAQPMAGALCLYRCVHPCACMSLWVCTSLWVCERPYARAYGHRRPSCTLKGRENPRVHGLGGKCGPMSARLGGGAQP